MSQGFKQRQTLLHLFYQGFVRKRADQKPLTKEDELQAE